MRRRMILLLAGVMAAAGFGVMRGGAQGSTPLTYSYTQDPALGIGGPTTVQLYRDGSKEAVDQIVSNGAPPTGKFQSHILYDFAAHKIYTKVISDPTIPCSVMDYTSPGAPPEFDMISGGQDLLKEMTADATQTKPGGTETLNGIPTKIMLVTDPKGGGKIWIAQNGGFPVRIDSIGPDGKAQTVLAMKQLSFAKPPASAFAVPAGCTAIGGEASAHGVHAEVGRAGSKPTTNVTALTLQKIGNYTGPCPAHIKMVGTITTDGPGKVFYQFGAGKFDPGETITFDSAGTKTVTHVMTFQPEFGNQMGGSAILQAIGTDAAGNHGILTQGSNNADFNINCTSGGGH